MNFRKLKSNEIDCRIATINKNGLTLLLYKDARVDMRILDETVGAENWQRKHEVIDGNLYCDIGIYDKDKKEWIWKQDVGTESYTEKEKGQASDSFKRAAFNWGIGRELYTAPSIWIDAKNCNIKEKDKKLACYDKFIVKSIDYDKEGSIINLVIYNQNKNIVVFNFEESFNSIEKENQKIINFVNTQNDSIKERIKLLFNIEKIEDIKDLSLIEIDKLKEILLKEIKNGKRYDTI